MQQVIDRAKGFLYASICKRMSRTGCTAEEGGEAFRVRIDTKKFETAEAVCTFIKKAHEDYLKIEHGVKEDCEYIVRVCHQVVQAILNLVSIAAGKEVERRLCPA